MKKSILGSIAAVLVAVSSQQVEARCSPCTNLGAPPALWSAELVQRLAKIPDPVDKLRSIGFTLQPNIAVRSDREVWGKDDYWASPQETLGKAAGDCEDFAILAGHFASQALPAASLRYGMGVANADGKQKVHVSLLWSRAWGTGAPIYVVDQLSSEVVPLTSRKDLAVTFTFVRGRVWEGTSNVPVPSKVILPYEEMLRRSK